MSSSVTVYSRVRSASLTFVVSAYTSEGVADTTALVLYEIDSSNQDKVGCTKNTHLCWRCIVLLEILSRGYGGRDEHCWASHHTRVRSYLYVRRK